MCLRDEFLVEISNFCAERGIAESTFGKYAVSDGRFVAKLRNSAVVLRTAEKAMRYIRDERQARADALSAPDAD